MPVFYCSWTPGTARFLSIDRGPVFPGSLLLTEARYFSVFYYIWRSGTARFRNINEGPVLPGSGFLLSIKPGTARFLIIHRVPVLPSFLVLMEAQYCRSI